jgi:hypothetical protein
MDFVRALKRLPRQLLWAIGALLRALGRGLSFVLGGLFGRVRWQAPDWMVWSGQRADAGVRAVRANPTRSAVIAGGAVALLSLAWLGFWWWQNRPKPELPPLVTAEVHAPERTTWDEEDKIVIHPLTVTFSDSIAPIALVGKPVTQGVRLEPPIEGKWTWESDRELKFEPAGRLARRPGLQALVRAQEPGRARALRDAALRVRERRVRGLGRERRVLPEPAGPDPEEGRVRPRLRAPVDPAEFEKRIALELVQPDGKKVEPKFVVSYDEKKLHGYVHSEPLAIPTSMRR